MERDELVAAADRALAEVLRVAARHAPGAAIEEDGGLLLVSTSPTWPGPYHNGALRIDPSLPAAEVLRRARAFFASRCAGYCVWVPDRADEDLCAAAVAAGLVLISTTGTPRMAIRASVATPRLPDGVRLAEVVDGDGRRDYIAVTVAAYAEEGLPHDAVEAQCSCVAGAGEATPRAVLATEGDRTVAAAMVVMAGDAASIELVGTVPGARGRGLGEACTAWAVNTAFASGARVVVLEASAAGEPLYRRMGFEEVGRSRLCFGPPRDPPA